LAGGQRIWAESGAAFEPNGIPLSTPCPDDFDAFWAAQKKRLAEVPMNPKLTPVEGNGVPASVEAFDVKVDCAGGAPVSAYFSRPKGAKPKSLPIYLTVHGAGVHSSSLMGPVGQAGQGRLAMDLNAHGIPNGKPAEYYANLLNGELRDYARRGLQSRETCYFLGMYLRLARAMEFLCSQPEWDGRNLFVSGSSQGGAQAIVAAGLDPRVTIFSASMPALCDLTGMQVNRSAGWPLNRTALDANQVRTVRYFDCCNFAARTKATAVVRVGLIDHTCPPAGVLAMYNQLKGTKYLFTYPDAGHSYSPPETYKPAGEKLRELIAEAVKK
jgi:cephalosporin-C deacetylase-like acetyl esterase